MNSTSSELLSLKSSVNNTHAGRSFTVFPHDRIYGALFGSFIGDALAMPAHWYYDLEQLQNDFGKILDYEAPRPTFLGAKMQMEDILRNGHGDNGSVVGDVILHGKTKYWCGQYHYHHGMAAGENTLEAQIARLVIRVLTETKYDNIDSFTDTYRNAYIKYLTTPNSHNDTYATSSHRMFFKNWDNGVDPKSCPSSHAHSDAMETLVILPAVILAAHACNENVYTAVTRAIAVTRKSNSIQQWAHLFTDMFMSALRGVSIREISINTASKLGINISERVKNMPGDPMTACFITSSFPSLLHFMYKYGDSPMSALLANANAGGDNAPRGAVLGALIGASYGIQGWPTNFIEGLVIEKTLRSEIKNFVDQFYLDKVTAAAISQLEISNFFQPNMHSTHGDKSCQNRTNKCTKSNSLKRCPVAITKNKGYRVNGVLGNYVHKMATTSTTITPPTTTTTNPLPNRCCLNLRRKNVFHYLRQRECIQSMKPLSRTCITKRFIPNRLLEKNIYPARVFLGQFSKEGDFFSIVSQDHHIKLYRTNQESSKLDKNTKTANWNCMKDIEARMVGWSIVDLSYSPNGQYLIYSTWSNFVQMCDIYGDSHEALDFNVEASRCCIFSVQFSPNNQEILAVSSDACLYIYDLNRCQRTLKIPIHADDVNSMAFSDNSSDIFLTASDDTYCKVWDRRLLRTNDGNNVAKPVGVFQGHSEGLTYVSPKGDGRYFITNGKDQCLKLWDIRKMKNMTESMERFAMSRSSGGWDYRWHPYRERNTNPANKRLDDSIMTYKGHAVLGTLIRCYFSPLYSTGQQYIYTGSHCGTIHIYDVLSGSTVSKLKSHGQTVRDISWHPYEPILLSTSWDCTVGRWQYIP